MNHKLRRLLVILLLLLLIGAILLGRFRQKDEALPSGSWGLSFPTEGQPSVGNTSNDRLLEYNAAYLGDTSKKVIYLTFDAGYENGCTEKILDTLKAHNAPAAFFLVGNYIEKNPEVIQSFTNALQKGMDYVQSHTPEEIAQVITPQFEETDLDTLTTIVKRYYDQDTWKSNLIFEKESFELLQDILESAGELEKRADYEKLVTVEYAEKAMKN